MVLLDGKKLAEKILGGLKDEIASARSELRLAAVVVGEDSVTKKFVAQKRKTAASVGIDVREYNFDAVISTNELRKRIAEIVHEKKNTGVIVQLPLPGHINTQYILNAVPPEKDADVLSARAVGNFAVGKSEIMPPVAGAIKAFFEEYQVDYRNKYAVIVGAGNLVGKPVALWLLNEKATFSIVRSSTESPVEFTRTADILISGTGKPNFITGDMVKSGVIMIDAGTSVDRQPTTHNPQPTTNNQQQSVIAGDVDFDSVAPKASYITPVPGGVGPVAVAVLLKNLVVLNKALSKFPPRH
ncbi:MAG: bifunctional 5,10-methylenetetrahydrofolate dehydrogenase/5,10-methenyltetrahydrofolate cyclohydrolase [Candidatus Sungbacteria bacterium]|nr:bifunctional 5,10-methylenetetrahydrofolate dehydrogenase/5,10-methenyltetrahydrofolate cyclohydrolase [Candidatus Sungbacteria bacterium]